MADEDADIRSERTRDIDTLGDNTLDEIGESIRRGLISDILATCSALFVDPAKTFGKHENLSLHNLIYDYEKFLSETTKKMQENIFTLVDEMNLKTDRSPWFRWKFRY